MIDLEKYEKLINKDVTLTWCSQCQVYVNSNNFNKNSNNDNGLDHVCKDCRKSNRLERLYGIDLGEYNKLLEVQGSKCAVCCSDVDLVIDKCGDVVKGLVCRACLKAIKTMRKDLEVAEKIIKYIKK